MNYTIVTGYWRSRDDRDESVYLDSLRHILSLDCNIAVLIPKRYNSVIEDSRKSMLHKTALLNVS